MIMINVLCWLLSEKDRMAIIVLLSDVGKIFLEVKEIQEVLKAVLRLE